MHLHLAILYVISSTYLTDHREYVLKISESLYTEQSTEIAALEEDFNIAENDPREITTNITKQNENIEKFDNISSIDKSQIADDLIDGVSRETPLENQLESNLPVNNIGITEQNLSDEILAENTTEIKPTTNIFDLDESEFEIEELKITDNADQIEISVGEQIELPEDKKKSANLPWC